MCLSSEWMIFSDYDVIASSHLHVELQDVRIALQQDTQVGFSATKVSVDELFDVTVG